MREEEKLLLSAAMGASIPKFTLTSTGGTPGLERYLAPSTSFS